MGAEPIDTRPISAPQGQALSLYCSLKSDSGNIDHVVTNLSAVNYDDLYG